MVRENHPAILMYHRSHATGWCPFVSWMGANLIDGHEEVVKNGENGLQYYMTHQTNGTDNHLFARLQKKYNYRWIMIWMQSTDFNYREKYNWTRVKEETSESPTEPQQHPELTGTFVTPTGTNSSRQQQLHPPPNYAHCHSPRAQTGFSPFLDHQWQHTLP